MEDTYYINVFHNMFFTAPVFGLDNLLKNIHSLSQINDGGRPIYCPVIYATNAYTVFVIDI